MCSPWCGASGNSPRPVSTAAGGSRTCRPSGRVVRIRCSRTPGISLTTDTGLTGATTSPEGRSRASKLFGAVAADRRGKLRVDRGALGLPPLVGCPAGPGERGERGERDQPLPLHVVADREVQPGVRGLVGVDRHELTVVVPAAANLFRGRAEIEQRQRRLEPGGRGPAPSKRRCVLRLRPPPGPPALASSGRRPRHPP